MVKIIISGICGKMGSRILALAAENEEIKVVGGIETGGHPMVGKKIPPVNCPVEDKLEGLINQADVLVDFSNPGATLEHLKVAEKFKKPFVTGTTGISEEQTEKIKAISRGIPVVLSPNMSIGVNLLFKLVGEVAKVIPSYNVEIVESHHNQKKDAPSGTALKLAEKINQASGGKLNYIYGRKGITGARKPDEIGILSVRAGDIVGEHTVVFAGTGERIELAHRAHSRDTFAAGALLAALWVVHKKPGLYDMQDVLGIR